MSHVSPATKPFATCFIDIIGGFGGSRSTKNTYYQVILLDITLLTSRTQNAKDFIKLVGNCTKTYDGGLILTDQYLIINSREFKRFFDNIHISVIFTAVKSLF